MRNLAVIACTCCTALAATPVVALSLNEMSASIEACFTKGNVETIVEALGKAGWQRVERPLPATTAEQLIWPQTLSYLTGDSGGEALKSIVDLQRKTIAGFARKKDIPPSKTRILSRQIDGQSESLLLLWQLPNPNFTNTICKFALSPASLEVQETELATRFKQIKPNPQQSITVTALNNTKLSAEIGRAVTVSGVIETHHLYQLEVAK